MVIHRVCGWNRSFQRVHGLLLRWTILIRREYRFLQMSVLVHPDKNQDDAERAQKAFEGGFCYAYSIRRS